MDTEPRPLAMGTVVGDRFEVEELLGRGGFGNVYLAKDLLRTDLAVLKELAPPGTRRGAEGFLLFDGLGTANAQHLRQRFLEEAKLVAKLHLRGIPQVRATFTDLGTAYFASDYLPGSQTLQEILDRQGRMTVTATLDVIHQVLETLEGLHQRGYLHRDLKPSNILVGEKGEAFLLDFGSAREWHADAGGHHTVLFTPGYAPMEQLSERARRGPATDLYALCATAYHVLTGVRPAPPPDRLEGAALVPIRTLRPEVPGEVAAAIESGLAMNYADRPQTAAAFRQLMEEAESEPENLGWEEIDDKLARLRKLSYERRQCPACMGVLDEPRPLKKGTCPVCHEGAIRPRKIDDRLCPVCRVSPIRERENANPPLICPLCTVGLLHRHRKGLLSSAAIYQCEECEGRFEASGAGMTLMDAGHSKADVMIGTEASFQEWRVHCGRAKQIFMCDGCGAQFDGLADGRRRQMKPKAAGEFDALYPDEWARVAAGLSPGSGNAVCLGCEADFFLDGENVTLLDSHIDPQEFAKENLGRLLTLEEIRWIGVGKDSPNPGYVCGTCRTEFDRDGDYLRLVQTPNRKLLRFVGSVHQMEDWHRIAQGLPTVADEDEFRDRLDGALREAYRGGTLSFDNAGNLLWQGKAFREDEQVEGVLEVTTGDFSFRKKWRVPRDAVSVVSVDGDAMTLRVSGERQPVVFVLGHETIEVELQAGRRALHLTAADLALRLLKP